MNDFSKKLLSASIFVVLFGTLLFSSSGLADDRGTKIVNSLEKTSGRKVGAYRALVIGINDYMDKRIPDLKTAVNDAREFSQILKSDYGFKDVTLLLDKQANESNIVKGLRNLATRSRENDSVLIYYAGHGELDQVTGSGYWIPHDSKGGDPSSYLDNAVIQNYIKAIPARHILLVADSCFSGSLFGEARSLPPTIDDKFYATLFKEKSRWGMTSGNLTPVSDNGSEGHSIFAYHLIKTLKENTKPFITPREIYHHIGPVVRNNSEQMPITKPIRNTGDAGGEFVFIKRRGVKLTSLSNNKNSSQDLPPPLPIPVPPTPKLKLGHLQINVNVMGANIFINNELKGKAGPGKPLNLKNLESEILSILVKADGFESVKKTIRIQANKWTQLAIELLPVQTAHIPPVLDLPKNSSSIKDMVKIPSGTYMAGIDPMKTYKKCLQYMPACNFGFFSDEGPIHKVDLDEFYIDRYEVTQKQYREVMGSNPSQFKRPNNPVEMVTWFEASKYCEKLGKRLPTGAEFEKAAKGGRDTLFPWGDEMQDQKGNFCDQKCSMAWKNMAFDDGYTFTAPVGSYPPNGYGLYDMAGNVFEWVQDWYQADYYKTVPSSNPKGPREGTTKSFRGGSWFSDPSDLRTSSRHFAEASMRLNNGGFRCVKSQ